MPIQLRILLIVGAVGTMIYFIGEIRKSQLQIKHALFWTVASIVLVIMSFLPTKVYEVIHYVGLQSPTNFVFLILIFALIVKQFSDAVKISVLERKLAVLTQKIALIKLDDERRNEALKIFLESEGAAQPERERKPEEGPEEPGRELPEEPGKEPEELGKELSEKASQEELEA